MARICERVVPGLEAEGARIEFIEQKAEVKDNNAVTVHYRVNGAGPFWLACQFADDWTAGDPPRLWALTSDRWGQIPEVKVYLLQRFWLDANAPDQPQ